MPASTKRRRGLGAGGLEYLSLDGLRLDGRRPGEVRKIRCALGALARADGSAYYEQGNTRVLAAVYGPREPKSRAAALHDRAVVRCEYSTAMFASGTRRRTWKGDRGSTAAASMVVRIFEGVVLVKSYPRSQIDIYVQVLQDDGGALVAAINASSLALINAGIAMSDFVVSCSVGYVDGAFVVDVNALESSADRPELTVAMLAHSGSVSSCSLDCRLPNAEALGGALEHATAGARQIFKVLEHEVRSHSLNLLDSRGLVAF